MRSSLAPIAGVKAELYSENCALFGVDGLVNFSRSTATSYRATPSPAS